MPPADGSSTRCGYTSVRGRVCSPHISGGRPAAGSQRADSLGSCATQPACCSLGWDRKTDRQMDGSRCRLMPPLQWGHNNRALTPNIDFDPITQTVTINSGYVAPNWGRCRRWLQVISELSMGWVRLGRVGSRFFSFWWVGLCCVHYTKTIMLMHLKHGYIKFGCN